MSNQFPGMGVRPEAKPADRIAPTKASPSWASGAASLVPVLLCLLAYYLAAAAGSRQSPAEYVVSYAVANAVLLALLLMHSPQWWGGLLVVVIGAHVISWLKHGSLSEESLPILLCNEGLIVCLAGAIEPIFRRAQRLTGFTRVGSGALVVIACLGVSYSQALGTNGFSAGSLVALVTVTPAVMAWCSVPRRRWAATDVPGAMAATLLVGGICIVAGQAGDLRWLVLCVLPLVTVWAGMCFGMKALTAALVVAALLCQPPVMNAGWGDGLQLFLFVTAACSLLLVRMKAEHGARIHALRLSLGRVRTTCRRTQAQLRARTERYKLTLRASNDVIFYWNVRANVLRWSANGRRCFGWAPRSCRAWPLLERCLDERDRDRVLGDLRAFMKRGKAVWRSEFTLKGRGGTLIPVRVRAILKRDKAGQPWRMIGAITDLSDARVARESARALARAARLATVGEITASITHEVNQPLAAILNNAETGLLLLQRKQLSSPMLFEVLEDIRNDARRASEVVRHTRSLLQDRELVRETVNVNKIVRCVVDLLWIQAQRRGITLSTSLGSIPPLRADEVHLQQVVINLISNALDATEICAVRHVEVSTAHHAGKAVVRVKDSGCGIPPAQLEAIFESFNTTKAEGLGIGLSIARSIVKAHGGRIFAENNKLGPGATVTFELPTVMDSTTHSQSPESQRDTC